MDTYITGKDLSAPELESVERKGLGHPDTLADSLAEHLSIQYANYTNERFGAVLHHNFDKLGLLGGSSYVSFGEGYMISPIRVLLNGRASSHFGAEEIPFRTLAEKWVKNFFKRRLPLIDVDKDLAIHFNLSDKSSPGGISSTQDKGGKRKYWFEPRNLNDLPELERLVSNDTSIGVGYAPLSSLEDLVIQIEGLLTSPSYQNANPWIGTDVKIMAFRHKDQYSITICIPQIASKVFSAQEYLSNLEKARADMMDLAESRGVYDIEIFINTRDIVGKEEFYLTAIGSSIESGDEGVVGRGNRINGLITPQKPMSIEGASGKNPVYHIGKIYYLAAQEIANKIYGELAINNEVYLISQSGRDLVDPWKVAVYIDNQDLSKKEEVRKIIEREIPEIPKLTDRILKFEFKLS